MAVMEVIIRAIDEASHVVDKIGGASQKAGGYIEQNWKQIGVASAAAGGAMEMAARKQAPLTEQTQKVAAAMDMTEGEIRSLAAAATDVTFPIEDVLGLMEKGRQQGIQSADALQEYAQFWDMVGDATGENAVMLGEASAALRAVGIAAGEEQEALAAFGYITEETSGEVGEFLRFLERTGPQLGEMGMDVDDAAAMLGILEHEFGMSGRTARTEFRSAVNGANGDINELFESLGITADQFDEYSGKVSESSEVIERNAEIHGDSYTMMERLQAKAGELMYRYGDLIGVVGNFAPLMMGLGPILKGITMAKGALGAVSIKAVVPGFLGAAKASAAFGAALLANPITWVIAGIIALVAAIWLIWKNWDQVSDFLVNSWNWIKDQAAAIWEGISEFFSGFWDTVKEIFRGALEFILNLFTTLHPLGIIIANWEEIYEFFVTTWAKIFEVFSQALEKIGEGIKNAFNAVASFLSTIWERIKGLFSTALEAVWGIIENGFNTVKDFITETWNTIANFFTETWQRIQEVAAEAIELLWTRIVEFLTGIIQRVTEWAGDLLNRAREAGRNVLEGFMSMVTDLPGRVWDVFMNVVQRILNAGQALWEAAKGVATGIWEGIKSGLGISSPSYIERAIDAIVDRAEKMPDELGQSFQKLKGLSKHIPEMDFDPGDPGAGAAVAFAGAPGQAGTAPLQQRDTTGDQAGEQVVRHEHSGTIRIEGVGPDGVQEAAEIVLEEIRREVRR